MIMKKTLILFILSVFISVGEMKAQDRIPGQPLPLFRSEEILHLDLEADYKAVFSSTDDSTYFPARITLTDNGGKKRIVEISIRTRGITRRQKSVCSFSPLRLNFPKKEMKNTPFEGQNAIKLVTHCDKPEQYEQNTIMEYLIYRAYNVLTDSSFKVRPAIINYIYSDNPQDTVRKFAFFIEREKHLEERLQGAEIEAGKIHPDRLEPFQTCLVDMFQYMIGNTDYSIYEVHNVVLFADTSGNSNVYPVPYDFDWSGLVSAKYASPNPVLNTEHVSDRVYRGLWKEPATVKQVIAVFNQKKTEIYQIFEGNEFLEDKEKKEAIRYLDEFYWIINNQRQVQTEFFDNARRK